MAGNELWKAHLALVLVQLNYGGYHVISKLALSVGINQLVFCVFRDLIALGVLVPVAYLKENTERVEWNSWSGVAKVGGTCICIFGAVTMAVYKGPVIWGDGFLDMHMQGAVIGKPSPEPVGWLAEGLLDFGLDTWHIGVFCLIGNCFCMALYIAFQAPLLARYPAGLSVTAYSYFFGASLMAISGFFGANDWADWALTGSEKLSVLYAGLVASALNYGLLTWSNKVLGPALVALYMPLQPLFSSILAGIFLKSSLYVGSVLGGGLIVGGLYCVTWGRMKAEKPHLSVPNRRISRLLDCEDGDLSANKKDPQGSKE